MSNRFHNKYHKHNHHTTPLITDPDSALDPIASASDPFLGDFNLDGDLIVLAGNALCTSGGLLSVLGFSLAAGLELDDSSPSKARLFSLA